MKCTIKLIYLSINVDVIIIMIIILIAFKYLIILLKISSFRIVGILGFVGVLGRYYCYSAISIIWSFNLNSTKTPELVTSWQSFWFSRSPPSLTASFIQVQISLSTSFSANVDPPTIPKYVNQFILSRSSMQTTERMSERILKTKSRLFCFCYSMRCQQSFIHFIVATWCKL